MYNRILVPTDGSKPATEAAEHGFTLAKQFGATVHILYIIEVGDYRTLNTYGGIDASLLSEDGMASIEKEAAEVVELLKREPMNWVLKQSRKSSRDLPDRTLSIMSAIMISN